MKRGGRNGAAPGSTLEGAVAVVFPGSEFWELWTGPGGSAVCTATAEHPGKLRPPPGALVGISTRSFFSVPLWVPMVGEGPGREQTQLRLEMKGLLGANPEGAIWASEAIRSETLPATGEGEPGRRQLETAAVLVTPFPEDCLIEDAGRYEPAARLLEPGRGGAWGTLRRELGRWVADFYVDGRWLHSQPLLAGSLDGSAAVELRATTAQLQAEGVLGQLDGWILREPIPPDPEFSGAMDLPLHRADRPTPRYRPAGWNLPPPALTERRATRAVREKRKRWIRMGVTGYLTAGSLLLLWLFLPVVQLRLARSELSRIGATADRIRQTAMLWQEAGACLDPRRNALELLWQVSRPLIERDPASIDGVRLTLFDLGDQRLLLQGEGKDLEVVEKYFQWLRTDPALGWLRWKNSRPRLLPNGFAQFQAEGFFPGAVSEATEGGESANPDGS